MAPTQAFAGSLGSKTKAELAEILKALDQDTQGLKADLEDRLEKYLTDHESALRDDNRYKGLYISRRKRRSPRVGSQSATPAPGLGDKEVSEDLSAIKDATADLASKAFDSAAATYDESVRPVLNSALEEGQDVATKASRRIVRKVKEITGFDENTVRIPDSPGRRALRSQANRAVDAAGPAVEDGLEMAERARKRTVEYWRQTGNREFRNALRKTQAYLSEPERLVKVMLFIELAYLLMRLAPVSKKEFQFPPSQFSFHTFDRLLYGIFWWMPEIKFQYRMPDIFTMVRPSSHAAGGFILWSFFTVLPAFLVSHLVSFTPQPPRPKPVRSTRSSQRSQKAVAPLPAWDPLVFCIVRFAIVVFPLTTAAPDFWRYQTEALGDLSGRALFAGLTGGMVLAERLGALVEL